jgi:hypothetical protein
MSFPVFRGNFGREGRRFIRASGHAGKKLQIPSSNLQGNTKSQAPKNGELGAWCFSWCFGAWILGAWNF